MALTYRNALKGHVVEVPEPADIMSAAEAEAERLVRKGTKRDRVDAELVMDKARSRALHQRQTLTKMDQSRRWERYTAPPVVAAPPPVVEAAPATAQPEPVETDVAPAKAAARPPAKVGKASESSEA